MRNDARQNRGLLEKGLYLLSGFYEAGVRLRSKGFENGIFREHRLPCRVISVGNLTVGGSGKTPMTMYLAQTLKDSGYSPAVLSRGYKGKMEKAGGVVSDGTNILMGPDQAGDEPFMMAACLPHIPFLVGADRYTAARKAIARFTPDVIILDDGFQHRRLHRDLDFVLVDATVGFGNGFLLPRGILREPLEALARADAIVMTRSDPTDIAFDAKIAKAVPHIPIFRSANRPFLYGVVKAGEEMPIDAAAGLDPYDFGSFQNKRILGFSGIARNTEFRRMVTDVSKELVDFFEFPDHYGYSGADLRRIFKRAEAVSVDCVVTTQKDYARIQGRMRTPVDLAVIGIEMDFGSDREGLTDYINQFLKPMPSAG